MTERRIDFERFLTTHPNSLGEYYCFPHCTDLEKYFKAVLHGEVDEGGLIRYSGIPVANIGVTSVTDLDGWKKAKDGKYLAVIKNPFDALETEIVIGSCNAIVVANEHLFAGYPLKGAIKIARPVRVPYQEEFRPKINMLGEQVKLPLRELIYTHNINRL